ncbi:MAG TPA: hypothetical protein VIM73_01310 [Polyangiaceae bacterium]
MVRAEVGFLLLVGNLVACGESPESPGQEDSSRGGRTGSGGSIGSPSTGGVSGSAEVGGSSASSSEVSPYFEPGERLKARVLALNGGAEILEGAGNSQWHDAELKFDCLFATDEKGVERCFPRDFVNGDVYADAGCTRPVLTEGTYGACNRPSGQYVVADRGVCAYQGFHIGAELPASTPLFFSVDGTSCTSYSGADDIGPIYELEPMPEEAFVAMRRVARARATGLDAYVREGEDGSWEILGFFDSAREASCFDAAVDWSPSSKCMPAYANQANSFVDASCERPIVSASLRSCEVERPTTIIEVQTDANACPTAHRFELYEIEEIRRTTSHQVDASGECVESATAEFYLPGEPVDLSTLPVLESLVVGTGEVRARFSGFDGVPYAPLWRSPGPFIDSNGGACLPFESPNGTVCVSTSFVSTTRAAFRYEDSSCSGAPVVPWIPRPTCRPDAPAPPGVLLIDQTVECPRNLAFAEAIAVTGTSVSSPDYTKNAMTGACERAAPVSPAPTYLRLGETLRPDFFPQIERVLRE